MQIEPIEIKFEINVISIVIRLILYERIFQGAIT